MKAKYATLKTITSLSILSEEKDIRSELALEKQKEGRMPTVARGSITKLMQHYPHKEIIGLLKRKAENPTKRLLKLEDYIRENPEYSLAIDPTNIDLGLQAKEAVKTRNMLYIPGSSIKGAILTALVNHVLYEGCEQNDGWNNYLDKLINKQGKNKKGKTYNSQQYTRHLLTTAIYWTINGDKTFEFNSPEKIPQKNEFQRWLMVRDTTAVEKAGVLIKLSRKGKLATKKAGSKSSGPVDILAESIKQNVELSFSIKAQNENVDVQEILRITNDHYRNLYDQENDWFNERKLPKVNPDIPESSTLIRMGFGSGNHATSIIPTVQETMTSELDVFGKKWRLTKSGEALAQTKWLAATTSEEWQPLGWATITIDEK